MVAAGACPCLMWVVSVFVVCLMWVLCVVCGV